MVRAGGEGASGRRDSEDAIRLTVAGVAARLGVAAPTLRTWDRRYGLGPSEHVAGSHRRYAARDIARLETMRELTLDGVAPADAARIALHDERPSAPETAASNGRSGEGHESPVPPEPGDTGDDIDDSEPVVDPLTLAAAAVDADTHRLRRMLRRAQRANGMLEAWHMLVRPALEMVVMREHSDRPGSDPEHLLRGTLLELVRNNVHEAGSGGPPVAIYPEADQVLDAHVLGGELAWQGASVRVLHPRLGTEGPQMVLESIRRRPDTLPVVLGVPDGAEQIVDALCQDGGQLFHIAMSDVLDARPGLHRARTLAGAVHEIMSLITPTNGSQRGR